MMSKGWHVTYLTLLLFLVAALFAPQNLKDKLLGNKEIQLTNSLEEELPAETNINGISKEIVEITDNYQGTSRVAVVFGVQQPRMLEIARHFQNKGWNVIAANNNRTTIAPIVKSAPEFNTESPSPTQPNIQESSNMEINTVQPVEKAGSPTIPTPELPTAATVNDNPTPNETVPATENTANSIIPTPVMPATANTPTAPTIPAVVNEANPVVQPEATSIVPVPPVVTSGEFITVQYTDNETTQEYYAAIHAALQKYGGKLDALILSDDDNTPFQLFEETDSYSFINEIDTNLVSIVNIIKELLPTLKENVGSKIIYVSSLGNKIGLPMASLYNASRFAISGFLESLYYEMQYLGIEVKTVALDSLSVDLEKNSLREQIATQYVTNIAEYRPFTAKVIENISKITNQDNDSLLSTLTAQLVYKAAIDTSNKFRYFEGADTFSIADKVTNLRNNQFKYKIGEQFGLVPPATVPADISNNSPVVMREEGILPMDNLPIVEEGTLEATAAEKSIAKAPISADADSNTIPTISATDTNAVATINNTVNSNSGVAPQATGTQVNSNQPNLPTPVAPTTPTAPTAPAVQPAPQTNPSVQHTAPTPSPATAPTVPTNSVAPTNRLAETPKA